MDKLVFVRLIRQKQQEPHVMVKNCCNQHLPTTNTVLLRHLLLLLLLLVDSPPPVGSGEGSDECSKSAQCVGFDCVPGETDSSKAGCGCTSPAACNDGNSCTYDACINVSGEK